MGGIRAPPGGETYMVERMHILEDLGFEAACRPEEGVHIDAVSHWGPFGRAGVPCGRLLSVDGVPVHDKQTASSALLALEALRFPVTVLPDLPPAPASRRQQTFTVRCRDAAEDYQCELEECAAGLWIVGVSPDGPFGRAGVPRGELISINGAPASDRDAAALVTYTLQRDCVTTFDVVVIPDPSNKLFATLDGEEQTYMVRCDDVDEALGFTFVARNPDEGGARIASVATRGPFGRAGVPRGRVVSINNSPVRDNDSVLRAIAVVQKSGVTAFPVVVVPDPTHRTQMYTVHCCDASENYSFRYVVDPVDGVVIVGVDPAGPFGLAGVPCGRLITINDTLVHDKASVLKAMLDLKRGTVFSFTVNVIPNCPAEQPNVGTCRAAARPPLGRVFRNAVRRMLGSGRTSVRAL
eukprot:TRINITY_DN13336_c0_g1_i1.p2 TRINITY_DN13336_c0_g1~~TRINITY_DN13336_c0_g1_i1.p2  ORF type:complete len:410 (+),score=78.59 TRINITY_DN13336_c0_g1_i1:52-1281(+)